MTPEARFAEIEDNCLDSHHAAKLTLVEDRLVSVVCLGCQSKIKIIEEGE